MDQSNSQVVAVKAETTISPPSLPAAMLALVKERPGGIDPWILRHPLTDAQRAGLCSDLAHVEAMLAPAPDDERKRPLARMLQNFRSKGDGIDELAGYVFATARYPAWAVLQACAMVVNGDIERDTHEFAPKPPTVARLTKSILAPWLHYRWELRQILAAVPEYTASEDERRRNAPKVMTWLQTFEQRKNGNECA